MAQHLPTLWPKVRLAYADPPYPGRSHLYRDHKDYAGEVDHAELVDRLLTFDGWALSTNSDSLGYVLSLVPVQVEVAAWIRTNAPPFNPDGRGAVRSWEPVVYSPARVERLAPDRVRDVFAAGAPTGSIGVGLTGVKPASFCQWLFGLLVAKPEDELCDLFPGSGAVGRAWQQWTQQPTLFSAMGGPRSGENAYRQELSLA